MKFIPKRGEYVFVSEDGKEWSSIPRKFLTMDDDLYVVHDLLKYDVYNSWQYAAKEYPGDGND